MEKEIPTKQDMHIDDLRHIKRIEEEKEFEEILIKDKKKKKLKEINKNKHNKMNETLRLFQSYDSRGKYIDIVRLRDLPSLEPKCTNKIRKEFKLLSRSEANSSQSRVSRSNYSKLPFINSHSNFANRDNAIRYKDNSDRDAFNPSKIMKLNLIPMFDTSKNSIAKFNSKKESRGSPSKKGSILYLNELMKMVYENTKNNIEIQVCQSKLYDGFIPMAGVTFIEEGKEPKKSDLSVGKCTGRMSRLEFKNTISKQSYKTTEFLKNETNENINQKNRSCSYFYNYSL